MEFIIKSSAFTEGGPIPTIYTGEGDDISPPLSWSPPPERTKSIAIICDDPDAPGRTWVHWVLYGLSPETTELPAGISTDKTVLKSAMQGVNDFGNIGYGGPMPPPGKPHRYLFKVYALDIELDLEPGATKAELEEAMKGRILALSRLIGTYER
jgi:Raf kinase inhibitor-like YbhB/YbcL family protein